MKQFLTSNATIGFLIWSGLIMLFDRHDLAFYGVTFVCAMALPIIYDKYRAVPSKVKVED